MIHERPVGQTAHTEFGDIKVAAGHIEAPVGGVMEPRFVERQAPAMPAPIEMPAPVMPAVGDRRSVIATKPVVMTQMNHPFVKEE